LYMFLAKVLRGKFELLAMCSANDEEL
jgi:hypothetical protein